MKDKPKNITLADLIDIDFLNKLFKQFYDVCKVPVGLLEPDGNILVAVGWQKVCTQFHRKGKLSCKNCIESDSHIAERLHENPPISYKCKNGLNDVAMPIIIEGNHIANLFFGQFFYDNDERDFDKFKKLAEENNFNVDEYIKALKAVPVYSKKEVDNILSFYMSLLKILTELGHKNILLIEKREELDKLVEEKSGELRERVKELNCLYKISDYAYEEKTIESFLKKVVEIIPPSFQYPEHCSVLITIHSKEYKSNNYKKSKWEIEHDILVDNEKIGKVEINYLEAISENDHGPFLTEELDLLNGIAELVGRTIDSKLKDLDLKEKNEEYLAINEELKEKNEEFLAVNEELKERNEEYQALNEEYLSQNEELQERNEEFQAINEELEKEIEKRAELQESLKENEKRLLLAMEGTTDGLWDWNLITNKIYFSKPWKKIIGYKDSELENTYEMWESLVHPEDIEHAKKAIDDYLKDKTKTYECEFRMKHKKGHWVNILSKGKVDINDKGEKIRFVGTHLDITEKKLAQLQLENTLKELERSNQELEQFAYVASHDLQEPLRKVKNFAELFARKYTGALDEKADQYIKYMTSGTDRMQNLILDLLSFSRVATRGKEFVKTDLDDVIKKVEENLQLTIEENNAKIVYDDLPLVKVDESQITQLFQNLISNALKFKSDNKPVIKIETLDKKDHWQIAVADNGIGLEMQYKERIFEVFQRLHTKEEYKGTGIGLAICKKIVERHKGKVWVESKLGEGSTFYFTIPKKLQ